MVDKRGVDSMKDFRHKSVIGFIYLENGLIALANRFGLWLHLSENINPILTFVLSILYENFDHYLEFL